MKLYMKIMLAVAFMLASAYAVFADCSKTKLECCPISIHDAYGDNWGCHVCHQQNAGKWTKCTKKPKCPMDPNDLQNRQKFVCGWSSC